MAYFILIIIIAVLSFLFIQHRTDFDTTKLTKFAYAWGKFRPYDQAIIENNQLHTALQHHDFSIYYIYQSKLRDSSEFCILIGLSNAWVDVYALNRKKEPTYERYGFNIYEGKWAGGRRVLGAKEIRKTIEKNSLEIFLKMTHQAEPRRKHKKEKEIERRADEKEEAQFKIEERQYKLELERVRPHRKQVLDKWFTSIEFKLRNNKKSLEKAFYDCENSFYNTSIETLTCGCPKFEEYHSRYPQNDIRRLCYHLEDILKSRHLFKKHPQPLENFILEEAYSLHNIEGVYFGSLSEPKPYALIALRERLELLAFIPKVTIPGYVVTYWNFQNGSWNPPKSGSKAYIAQIAKDIEKLFG